MKNIRFVASDLDGTLLLPNGSLPENTFSVIRKLKEKGILFCAASGRQYANLYRLFAPIAKDMCFICENGAYVTASDQSHASRIPAEMSDDIIHDILESGMELLLSLQETSVMLSSAKKSFTDDIFYRLKNTCTIIPDHSLHIDQYIKISGFCENGVSHLAPALQDKWGSRLHVDIAGANWLDFTLTNKGDGIRSLSALLNIPTAEMAAFGDQFNDLAMLQTVGHPYLMENAPEGMKKFGFPSCKNVLSLLEELL